MDKFDKILNDVNNTTPAAKDLAGAAARVRQSLFGVGGEQAAKIRGCTEFQTLLAAYVSRTLAEPRRLLVEDHLRDCVDCRRALNEVRGTAPRVRPMPIATPARPRNWRRWAVAAALAVGVALAGVRTFTQALDGGPVARVEGSKGMLYAVADSGLRPVGNGAELADGEALRTVYGTASVRLADGSVVEINERAQVGFSRGWRGTTLRLDRGAVIVEAAKQRRGRLMVATGDGLVTVKGTIFSVNRGIRGSRVSVVEGEVAVDAAGRHLSLKPGEQAATEPSLESTAVTDEVSWSTSAARYLALLGELNILQRKLEAVRGPGLRYTSRLLNLVPPDSLVVAAIPNAAASLIEAKRIFDEELLRSPMLAEWWKTHNSTDSQQEINEVLGYLRRLGSELGDEVLVVFNKHVGPPVLLAEVKGTGLRALLDQILKEAGGTTPAFYYSIANNTLVLADTAAARNEFEVIAARGSAPTSPFRDRIAQSYRNGAGWLLALNMEQILAKSVPSTDASALGFANVRHLVVERREINGKTENNAAMSFTGARTGVPSWLGAPGAMGSLDFVTPEAGAAVSIVAKSPRAIVDEMFALARKQDPLFDQHLREAEAKLGISIAGDLAASLGSDATFAIDGSLIPVPAWKFAIEAFSPARLQWVIERLVEAANREVDDRTGRLLLTRADASGRTFWTLKYEKLPWEIHYTVADTYFLAGASRALLTQAIDGRRTGRTLARSDRFRAQLPSGVNPNFSALAYHNFGGMLGPAIDQLKDTNYVTPAMRAALLEARNAPPGLITAQGEGDRIAAATLGTFFGVNLSTLAGLEGLGQLVVPGGFSTKQ